MVVSPGPQGYLREETHKQYFMSLNPNTDIFLTFFWCKNSFFKKAEISEEEAGMS